MADDVTLPADLIQVAIRPPQFDGPLFQERLDEIGKMVRIPDVILVQKGYQVAVGMLDADVPG